MFEWTFLRDVVSATMKARLSLLGCLLQMRLFHIIYTGVSWWIPEIAGLLICNFIANAISTAVFHVSAFSAKSLFCVCLFLNPQTKRSRSAFSKHFLRTALYAATPSPSCCSREIVRRSRLVSGRSDPLKVSTKSSSLMADGFSGASKSRNTLYVLLPIIVRNVATIFFSSLISLAITYCSNRSL